MILNKKQNQKIYDYKPFSRNIFVSSFETWIWLQNNPKIISGNAKKRHIGLKSPFLKRNGFFWKYFHQKLMAIAFLSTKNQHSINKKLKFQEDKEIYRLFRKKCSQFKESSWFRTKKLMRTLEIDHICSAKIAALATNSIHQQLWKFPFNQLILSTKNNEIDHELAPGRMRLRVNDSKSTQLSLMRIHRASQKHFIKANHSRLSQSLPSSTRLNKF